MNFHSQNAENVQVLLLCGHNLYKSIQVPGVPVVAQWLTNPTRNHEVAGSIPGVATSCGVGHRLGSDPALLWLWRRPASTSPIRPLAWEPPHAAGAAQEMAKRQKKQKTKKRPCTAGTLETQEKQCLTNRTSGSLNSS